MPKLTKTYHYACPLTVCDSKYVSPVELSDYPVCNTEKHTKIMNFIERKSSGVPEHILAKGQKSTTRDSAKVNGGNWIRD